MLKPRLNDKFVRTALISALIAMTLACTAVFFGVSAAESVSPSDLPVSATDQADPETVVPQGKMDHQEFPGFWTSNLPAIIRNKDTNFVKDGYFSGSYREQLTDIEKQIYDAFYNQYVVKKRSANEYFTINFNPQFPMEIRYNVNTSPNGAYEISGLFNAVCSAYAAFSFDHPEVYWVRGFGYNYYFPNYEIGDKFAYLDWISVSGAGAYNGDYAERSSVSKGYAAAVKEIKNTRASSSRYDTVKRIHDYVCEHSVYNYDALNIASEEDYWRLGHAFTAAPLFTGRGTFVCEGYSRSFKMLCDALDVPCVCIAGFANGGNHMWNYVQMEDNGWYAVDSTWDDNDVYSHDYFLVGRYTEIKGATFEHYHMPYGNVMQAIMPRLMEYPVLSKIKYGTEKLTEPVITLKNPYFPNGATAHITWNPVNDATGYRIILEKSLHDGTGRVEAFYDEIIHDTSFDFSPPDFGLPYDAIYHYLVYAIDETNTKLPSDYGEGGNGFLSFGFQNCSLEIFNTETEFPYGDNIRLLFTEMSNFPSYYHFSIKKNGETFVEEDIETNSIFFCDITDEENEEVTNRYFYYDFTPPPGEFDVVISAILDQGGYQELSSQPYHFTVKSPPVILENDYLWFVMEKRGTHLSKRLHVTRAKGEGDLIWYSDTPEVATVEDGVVTAVSAGMAKIYCKYVGDEETSLPCVVDVDSLLISSDNDKLFGQTAYYLPGETDHLTIGKFSVEEIQWKSSNSSVVSIDSEGNLVAHRSGSATITGISLGILKDKITVKVVKPTQNLSLNRSKADVYVGAKTTVKAIMDKGATEPIFWSAEDPSIVSVGKGGVIKGLSMGTTRVVATSLSGKTASTVITVHTKAKTLEWGTTHPNMSVGSSIKYGIGEGESLTLEMAIAAPENCNDTIKWSLSRGSSIAFESISDDGRTATVRGIKKGTQTVTVKTGSGKKLTATVTVVTVPASQITLNKTYVSLYTGASVGLTAKTQPKGNNDVVLWKSADPSVATVDPSGKIKGIAQGVTSITAYSSRDGAVMAVCDVLIRTKAQSVKWVTVHPDMAVGSSIKHGIGIGDSLTLEMAILSPDNSNDTVSWTTSNKSIVPINYVSADGHSATVSGLKKGTATITAKTGSGKKLTATVTVVTVPASQITLNKTNVSLYTGATVSLTAKTQPKGNNDVVLWKSADPSVATVDPSGKIKGIAQGVTSITAYSSRDGSVMAVCDVLVRTKAQSLKWVTVHPGMAVGTSIKHGIGIGDSLTLEMAILSPENSNDTVSWTTSNKGVVPINYVSADGHSVTVSGLKKGTATITAKTGSGKKLTATVTVVATPASQITLNRTWSSIHVGSSLSIIVKAQPKGNNDVILWKSADPSIAAVDPSGKVKGISQGETRITAYSAMNGEVMASCTILVRSKAEAVRWVTKNPYQDDITYIQYTAYVGKTFTLSMEIVSPEGCNDSVTWTTNDKSVARIDYTSEDSKEVTITAVKRGFATITGKTGSGKKVMAAIIV